MNYLIIEKIIEDWYLNKPSYLKIPNKINTIFKSWCGITFEEFKIKVHPKFIQKKLKYPYNVPNLFNNNFVNTKPILPSIKIIKWELQDDILEIKYNFQDSFFGELLIATTTKGICWLTFVENQQISLQELQFNFPNAAFKRDHTLKNNFSFYNLAPTHKTILHIKGTDFQIKIWKTLIAIPLGHIKSYGNLSEMAKLPKEASRAVGNAISKNPIACYIPCHRIVRNSGVIGNFRWKQSRKIALIGWEAVVLLADKNFI